MPDKRGAYEPVPPPYDLDDIEQGPEEGESSQSTNINSNEGQNSSNLAMREEGPTRMSQHDCCCFALAFFLVAVLGVVALATIIGYFNYLGRKH